MEGWRELGCDDEGLQRMGISKDPMAVRLEQTTRHTQQTRAHCTY